MINFVLSWKSNVNMQTAGSPGGPPPGEGGPPPGEGGPPPGEGTPPPPPGDMGGEGMHTPHEPG
ncbi:MAG: hypothetical protein CL606_02105, partial [Anaerolineaceae bacterium]|nr:hypothetical protein [Anaerolineaceae bacterium]